MIEKNIKKIVLVSIVFFVLSTLVGCGNGTPSSIEIESTPYEPTTVPTVTPTFEKTVVPPEDNVNSDGQGEDESGIKEDKGELNFTLPQEGIRPYAVMIDNEGTRPLPQGGIYLAQIVYEIIVEGGTSRLMPVFWDKNPTMIGPVRSSRHYFLDYAMEHDAIYVHFGYSPMAIRDLKKYNISNINGVANGGEVFWDLTKDRGNWQDSYTSMEKVKDYVKRVRYRTNTDKELLFKYSEKDYDFEDSSDAFDVNVRYSTGYDCSFKYDEDKKLYLRYRKGKPQMERLTDGQLTAKNIIIQRVLNYGIKGDDAGRQELNTVGSGSGYYISNGKCIEIKWSKKSRTDQTKYTDLEGNQIVLNPGQTWIQITPINSKVSIK